MTLDLLDPISPLLQVGVDAGERVLNSVMVALVVVEKRIELAAAVCLHDEVDEEVTVVAAKALDPVLLDHEERIGIDAKTQLLNDRLPKPFACELFPVVAESACLYASQSYVVVPLSSAVKARRRVFGSLMSWKRSCTVH